jgi:hypothetical protein
MEIKLKPIQLQLLTSVQASKEAVQAEYNKLVARESELVTVIVEAHGGSLKQEIVLDTKSGTVKCMREGEELIDQYIEQLPKANE